MNGTIRDFGMQPLVVNIDHVAKANDNYRIALWTGKDMQVTLMNIPAGGDIGVEMHSDVEQFIRIESGTALVMIGETEDNLNEQYRIDENYAIIIPAGTWHNIVNVGRCPLKLYSVYAPVQHPFGTVQKTKEEALLEEEHG